MLISKAKKLSAENIKKAYYLLILVSLKMSCNNYYPKFANIILINI